MTPILSLMAQAVSTLALAQSPQVPPAPATVASIDAHAQALADARALATSGRREEALAAYDAMLLQSPGNTDVLLARGRTLAWMERYAEAEADLRAVTTAKPTYADAWSALGDLYLWSGRPDDALAAYDRWQALAPGDADAANAQARARQAAQAARTQAPAAPVVAQAADAMPRVSNPEAVVSGDYLWSLRVGADHTRFSGGRAAWNEADLSLRRRFSRGSLALELLRARRFGDADTAWALDAYASLWARAYANARYQHSDGGGNLPDASWRVELFQGGGQGWELSASVDHLRFASDTEFYGVGVGRYVGNWYLRYKLQHVPGLGDGSWGHRGLVRNYYRGNADDYVELSAGSGRSDDLDAFGSVVRDSNASVGVAWVHFPHPRIGFRLGAGYADDADGFDERRVSVGVYTRW